jgi:hypothetical protein
MTAIECPATVKVKAIDVKPYRYAVWCTVEDWKGDKGKPFANVIEHRGWSKDGESIWFMLGSHNFMNAKPDEEMELIEHDDKMSPDLMARFDKEDEEAMAKRPRIAICPTCGHLESMARCSTD